MKKRTIHSCFTSVQVLMLLSFLCLTDTVRAHTCGPPLISIEVGATAPWQITADLMETETIYTPAPIGDPKIATISPNAVFTSHHGVFTITGIAEGTTSFAVDWYYEPTDAGDSCPVEVTVVPAGFWAPFPPCEDYGPDFTAARDNARQMALALDGQIPQTDFDALCGSVQAADSCLDATCGDPTMVSTCLEPVRRISCGIADETTNDNVRFYAGSVCDSVDILESIGDAMIVETIQPTAPPIPAPEDTCYAEIAVLIAGKTKRLIGVTLLEDSRRYTFFEVGSPKGVNHLWSLSYPLTEFPKSLEPRFTVVGPGLQVIDTGPIPSVDVDLGTCAPQSTRIPFCSIDLSVTKVTATGKRCSYSSPIRPTPELKKP